MYIDDLCGRHHGPWHALRAWMNQCRKATVRGIQFGASKVILWAMELDILGTEVSEYGRRPSPERIEGVLKIPRPKSRKQISTFLGFIGWYRDYVKDLSDHTVSLPGGDGRREEGQQSLRCQRRWKKSGST